MADLVKLLVPDLGDFEDVEIIEVLVSPGDTVAVEDGLVTLETDKASMDVPASHAGKIVSVDVAVGDTVSTGDVVATIEASEPAAVPAAEPEEAGEEWDVRTQRMTPEKSRQPPARRNHQPRRRATRPTRRSSSSSGPALAVIRRRSGLPISGSMSFSSRRTLTLAVSA